MRRETKVDEEVVAAADVLLLLNIWCLSNEGTEQIVDWMIIMIDVTALPQCNDFGLFLLEFKQARELIEMKVSLARET